MNSVEESQRLQIKSYFDVSVEAAVERARRELGPDALLIHSREAPPEAVHLGAYEVVFALAPEAPAAWPAPEMPRGDSVALLIRQMKEVRDSLARLRVAPLGARPPAELSDLYSALLDAGLPADLALDVVHSADRRLPVELRRPSDLPKPLSSRDPVALRQAVAAELESRFAVDAGLPGEGGEARALAVIGPPGSGKTSTLVKLAARGALARRPVQLISMDTHRIGAAEQLRSYAAILGAGFRTLETAHALFQAILEDQAKSLILIDTAGFSGADREEAGDLARLLRSQPGIEKHLVLAASMKPADIERVSERFESFAPDKLIFTRLDETDSYCSIVGEAARAAKPVSFLSGGPMIPEDLEPAAKPRLIELLLGECRQAAQSAA